MSDEPGPAEDIGADRKITVVAACRLSPKLSPQPANGSQFQPTPANSQTLVRFCDFRDLRGKTRKPSAEGGVLANRRLQPLGHLTARIASIRCARACEITVAPALAFTKRIIRRHRAGKTVGIANSRYPKGFVPRFAGTRFRVAGTEPGTGSAQCIRGQIALWLTSRSGRRDCRVPW